MNNSDLPSLKRQLQLFIVLTLGFAVLVMGGIWITSNRALLEQEAERMYSTQAEMIGAATKPAMMFHDKKLATEMITKLNANSGITVIRLFTFDGIPLAGFPDMTITSDNVDPGFMKGSRSVFEDGILRLNRTVFHKQKPVGVIYIESDLVEMKRNEQTGMMIIALVITGILMVGFFIAMRLQYKVTKPIISLAKLMNHMGAKQDYSLRSNEPVGSIEISELVSGFNHLAEQVEENFAVIESSRRALTESEKRFRSIAESAPLAILISRRSDSRILFGNHAASRLLAPLEILRLAHAADFYQNPKDRQILLQILSEKGELNGYELEIKTANGQIRWIALSMLCMRFEDEDALFSAFTDITEQKAFQERMSRANELLEERVRERTLEIYQSSQALQQSQESTRETRDELQSILDNMVDTYYRIDARGHVAWASKSVEALVGYDDQEVIGIPLPSLLAEPTDFRFFAYAMKCSKLPVMHHETRLMHKNGNVVWVSVSAHYTYNSKGETGGIEGVIRNVTEQVISKREKQDMEQKMAHVQRLESLGVLAGGIAHDFNNLLSVIMGNTGLANMKLGETSPVAKETQNIMTASEHAADLCKQMLAYSGQGNFLIEYVDLSKVVMETAQLLDVSISKKVTLNFELSDALPSINADVTQMQQVVMNLVTNASEAIGEESGVINISTDVIDASYAELYSEFLDEALPAGRYVVFQIDDDGCGLDEVTRKKIFDPFFSTKFTGRGLGMSAILGIVRSHNGSIQIKSQPGQGTTIRILLPASDGVVKKRLDFQSVQTKEKQRDTILVVDDQPAVLAMATAILESMDYSVLAANGGRQGVDIFRDKHDEIAAVLLDMTMPDMNGKEVFAELCKIQRGVKVILASGYSKENIFEQFQDVGEVSFLQKPYSSEALQNTINQLLYSTLVE